jgi:hypothetical protein
LKDYGRAKITPGPFRGARLKAQKVDMRTTWSSAESPYAATFFRLPHRPDRRQRACLFLRSAFLPCPDHPALPVDCGRRQTYTWRTIFTLRSGHDVLFST